MSGAQDVQTEGFGKELRNVDSGQIIQNYKTLKRSLGLSVLYCRQYQAAVAVHIRVWKVLLCCSIVLLLPHPFCLARQLVVASD